MQPRLVDGPAGRDALAPWLDDRRQDDLQNVRFVGVVGAERPLAFAAEGALEKSAEDGWLDVPPVEFACCPREQLELVGVQVNVRRPSEERSVGVRRVLVEPVFGPGPGVARYSKSRPSSSALDREGSATVPATTRVNRCEGTCGDPRQTSPIRFGA